MPKIVEDSLFTIRTTAVGLSMFSSGTFIARQSRFVPCGYKIASFSMVIKFLIGPVVMLFASLVIGMHGTLLHIAVVQVRSHEQFTHHRLIKKVYTSPCAHFCPLKLSGQKLYT
jgi:predicted permease